MRSFIIGLLLCCVSQLAPAATDLDSLLDSGKLTIDSRLDHSGALVPGQKARMVVEIATNSWFSGGTKIRLPEVPGLVILQTEQFAANASESRGGETWVIQRWTIDLYPQRAGDFQIPPMSLTVKVNGGELGNLEGEALSPPLDFSVSLPPALEQADFWVASPDFSVRQTIDRDTAQLKPGDAFERRIEFNADDVLAMMLPEVSEERQPGLASYPAPPVLENSNNRGQSSGSRVQTISYVAEKAGSYLLPAQDFFWWNTRTQELNVLSIPAIEVAVFGPAGQTLSDERRDIPWKTLIWISLVLAAMAVMMVLFLRYQPWRYLEAVLEPLRKLWEQLRQLRKPALPPRLNPDSSAGD